MTKDEALKLALEVLEDLGMKHFENTGEVLYKETFTAIKEALAQPEHEWVRGECVKCGQSMEQPEQKPVVWMYQDKSTHEVRFQKHMRDFVDHSKTSEVPLYSESLANHELQCVCGAVWCGDEMVHTPNKSPPQRKPLTDDQILANETLRYHFGLNGGAGPVSKKGRAVIDAIEAAHGIKE